MTTNKVLQQFRAPKIKDLTSLTFSKLAFRLNLSKNLIKFENSTKNILTREKKFAWQSSRLAPLVWVPAWLLMLGAYFSCLRHYKTRVRIPAVGSMDHRFHDHGGVKKFRVRTVKKQQAQVERRTNSVIGHFLGSRDQRRGEGKSEPSMEPSKNNWNCKVKQKLISM